MARIKPDVKKIESLDDADLTLREIGIPEREMETVDGGARRQTAEIKTAAVKAGEPIRKRIADLSALPGVYAGYSRADLLKDRKTVQVSFGVSGCRKSTGASVKKTAPGLLKKPGLLNCVRTKEEPDKEAMAAPDDETPAPADAVRKVKDEFFCEADKDGINKDLLKEQAQGGVWITKFSAGSSAVLRMRRSAALCSLWNGAMRSGRRG